MSFLGDIISVGLFISIPQVLGYLSTSVINGKEAYYNSLRKPFWALPLYLYRPLLTLFYGLMGISSYLIYNRGNEDNIEVKFALLCYVVQLFFSVIWPTFYFKFGTRLIALYIAAAILISLAATLVSFETIDTSAARLLSPYLIWSVILGYFNKVTWRRNQKGYIEESKKINLKEKIAAEAKGVNSGKFCSCCGTPVA